MHLPQNKKLVLASKRYGFTIVELLIVLVVIAILAAITYVGFGAVAQQAKVSAIKHGLSEARHSVLSFTATDPSENYPSSLEEAGISNDGDVTFQYSHDNDSSPKTFCITATTDSISYRISSVETSPIEGACQGHSQQVYYTSGGWTKYPIPWSSGDDRGYGPYYGVYFPSNLKPENSGQLTLFNPYSLTSAQGGVRTYLYCRNTSTNAISSSTGPTFANFSNTVFENTVSWSCPGGSVLYALNIGSTSSGADPDAFAEGAKNRTWYSQDSPNYVAPVPYVAPVMTADPAGWVSSPIPWGSATYSDLGYGPYYGVYIPNDPNKNLAATQTGTLQLYNPYAPTRAQGGVALAYWCKDATTGMVTYKTSSSFSGTFNSASTTKETNWSCPAGSVLFAAYVGSSGTPSSYFPNLETTKTRYWFSGESVSPYPSYIDSIRTKHD